MEIPLLLESSVVKLLLIRYGSAWDSGEADRDGWRTGGPGAEGDGNDGINGAAPNRMKEGPRTGTSDGAGDWNWCGRHHH
eukprot:jgi/Botrbrau1/11004/Bobra.101_1s0002.1